MRGALQKLLDDYGPYLEELRTRLLFSTLFFGVLFVVSFALSPLLIEWFVGFFGLESVSYVVTSPFQSISLSVNVGLSLSVVLFLPLLLAEVYTFVAPALTTREKIAVGVYTLTSIFLFFIGFVYGFAVLYYALFAIIHFNTGLGLANLWDISTFFSQIVSTSVLLGIVFQFPLLLYIGLRANFVTLEFLKNQRRVVVALSVVIVALLPPTDGLSLIIMAAPVIGLFELVLLLGSINRKVAGRFQEIEIYS